MVFYAIYAGTHSFPREKPELQQGHADLIAFDLEDKLAILPASSFIYYPNVLYTPETVPDSLPAGGGAEIPRREWEGYGTYRMILELPVIGIPGASVDSTELKTGYYTARFIPETDRTEILIQAASFCYGGCGLNDLMFGTAENIRIRTEVVQTRIHMIEGSLLTTLTVVFTTAVFYKSVLFLSLCGYWLFLIYAVLALTIHLILHRKTLRMDQILAFIEFLLLPYAFS